MSATGYRAPCRARSCPSGSWRAPWARAPGSVPSRLRQGRRSGRRSPADERDPTRTPRARPRNEGARRGRQARAIGSRRRPRPARPPVARFPQSPGQHEMPPGRTTRQAPAGFGSAGGAPARGRPHGRSPVATMRSGDRAVGDCGGSSPGRSAQARGSASPVRRLAGAAGRFGKPARRPADGSACVVVRRSGRGGVRSAAWHETGRPSSTGPHRAVNTRAISLRVRITRDGGTRSRRRAPCG